ncbi:hypothetical protein AB0E04_38810 [Streptomyces sp. NPDC048251]|uniref:hypothetical protein n=1 Tax=Streptomyces sp. NPDC048251 TaxID=3154501 RepID=UPI0034177104
MSNTTPPPGFPPLPPLPPAVPKKSRTNAIIIGSAAAVIAAVVATGIVVVQSTDDDSKPAATSTASSVPDEDVVTPAAEEPEPAYAYLDTGDFTMNLRTTKRQCFGSAGCNVTVEPNLTYVGSGDINPDVVYEITYEIRGDESGPVIATAELSNETSLSYAPSLISTASSGTKVSVKITDVVPQGG